VVKLTGGKSYVIIVLIHASIYTYIFLIVMHGRNNKNILKSFNVQLYNDKLVN